MRAAKKEAITCARADCPEALARDCTGWLDELKRSTPTVVFDVRDDAGAFQRNVRIFLDDELVTEQLDGRAVEVDPGAHVLRAAREGFPALEERIVVPQGEKNVKIALQLERATVKQVSRPVPMATWIFGGVGVAGLALGTIFTVVGLSKKSDLDACKPNCPSDDVDGMMRNLAIGDVGLAAGVVSGAAALTFYLTRPEVEEEVVAAPGASDEVAVRLSVAPNGAALRVDF
jgi:hypothetical protein